MKISVCMTSYNGEKYINAQIQSILQQLAKDDRIIISDDGSADKTLDIIKSFKDKRIILIEGNNFNSPVYNMENALKKAEGDFIFLADQDDYWLENKVTVMKKYLKDYDLVISDCTVVDGENNVIAQSFYKIMKAKKGFLRNLVKNRYLGCCMAFNRKILDLSLPFPEDLPMHDIWLGMVAELFGRTYFCSEKLVLYRRHEGNASPTTEKSPYSIWKKIGFRISLIKNLIILTVKKARKR